MTKWVHFFYPVFPDLSALGSVVKTADEYVNGILYAAGTRGLKANNGGADGYMGPPGSDANTGSNAAVVGMFAVMVALFA